MPAPRAWADLATAVYLEHDAWATLIGGLGDTGPGMVVQAGTGSIVVGRAADGSRHRAGGWGPLIGDEGSGYGIGAAGLAAAARARDGAGPTTTLTEAIPATWRLRWDDLALRLYRPGWRRRVAALAPLVIAEAARDDVAHRLLHEQARALARQAHALSVRPAFAGQDLCLVLAGGVLDPPTPFTPVLLAALACGAPHLRRVPPAGDATEGAAAIARALAGAGTW